MVTPITWTELGTVTQSQFTAVNVYDRLKTAGFERKTSGISKMAAWNVAIAC